MICRSAARVGFIILIKKVVDNFCAVISLITLVTLVTLSNLRGGLDLCAVDRWHDYDLYNINH